MTSNNAYLHCVLDLCVWISSTFFPFLVSHKSIQLSSLCIYQPLQPLWIYDFLFSSLFVYVYVESTLYYIFSLLYSLFPYSVYFLLHYSQQRCVCCLFDGEIQFGITRFSVSEREGKTIIKDLNVSCANKQIRRNIVSKIESTHFDLRWVISSMSGFNVLIFTHWHRRSHTHTERGRKRDRGAK